MSFIISQSFYFIIPLLIVALAGLFSEKSGTVNIALEGIMVIGAFFGVLFLHYMQSVLKVQMNPQLLLLLSLIVAGIAGLIFSSLLGFLAIKMRADQTIGGTALNLLAAALVVYLSKAIVHDTRIYFSPVFEFKSNFLHQVPFVNYVFYNHAYLTTYIGILILIITVLVFKYTKFGLRLSACGEHPQAAQSAGINVIKYRWAGVLISGFLGGLGGLAYVIPTSISFEGTVSGYGFLALAVLIFGQWKPSRVLLAAILFGFFKTLSVVYFGIDVISGWMSSYPNIPFAMFFRILPYVVTLIVLAITSKKSRAPKASGIPFDPLAG